MFTNFNRSRLFHAVNIESRTPLKVIFNIDNQQASKGFIYF